MEPYGHPDRPAMAAAVAPAAGAVRLRPAAASDVEACGRIVHAAFKGIAEAHGFPPDFPSTAAGTRIAEASIASPAAFGVVAESGGKVVGSNFLWEGDPIRAVGPITVDPAFQGGGVGRRLMEAVLERAEGARGVRLVQDAFNTRSAALYASLCFEVKEPLLLLRGTPGAERQRPGFAVRPMAEGDLGACASLCASAHGVDRTKEVRERLRLSEPVVVERGGRVTGYLTAPAFWLMNHGVAEAEEDMAALLAGAAALAGSVSLLLPTRQAGLFRRCLAAGFWAVKPMALMAMGEYREPKGCWFPSVLY